YIPQDPDPGRRTVESQEKNETSLLNYVRALLTLRRNHPALGNNGDWKLLSDPDKPYPMIYEREYEGEKCLVVLNPTSKTVNAPFPYYKSEDLSVIGGSYNSCTIKKIRRVDTMFISPVSVVIYKVK
ncbi:MAG: alpha-amylase, partial [Bacteroidales bacterium]|nr:alpha-amylase [Bacteroidales bacterium]